ncbi:MULTISPECIES: NADAR family protein [unclassified Pseudomonas]|uniref:NADAR family protein n=1 Tax=unclassified Pseudomonas TaxID=196821 RepID=UPI000BA47631|nr:MULTISPECIES: NADAR family protein [unclassified Pseudomonas]MCU1730767.1 NADAR family protein [Pseudomonas sp. 20P_3.2_Bac4]MCU1742905.1 NADAR family protein [Pseudomonas sp. 20P_3.2_Bac5]
MQILFYETDKPYGCFSNFSRHPITLDGILWPTTEHYFQACKFTEQVDIDAVREAKTPFLAAQIGRERHRSFRSDWDQARDPVMLEALRAKFTQHADLRETLLGTGDAELVEHTKNDRYWADGGDGSGKNMLGKLLEQVRAELNQTH